MSIQSAIACYILAAGIIAIGMTISYQGIRLSMLPMTYTPPPPKWSIVCNDDGRYSFVDFDGNVNATDFETRKEAEDEMEKSRIWSLKYEDDRASGKLDQERKAKALRQASFKVCPPIKK